MPNNKRDRIIDAGIHEIATRGYQAANVNLIAQKAGVSVGTLYNYFKSKQELFDSIINKGQALIIESVAEVRRMTREEDSLFDVLENLFYVTLDYSEKHSELCLIYLDLSTEKYSHNVSLYTEYLEKTFIDFYQVLLERACTRAEIVPSLNLKVLSFMLDNLVIMLQYSNSSTYYRTRLLTYLDIREMPDKKTLSKLLVDQLRLLLAAKE